ncbi:aldo/keto reductase [Sphingomonas japonica]|uniref:Diketogulonate reductase-like aldo/keto reductase n=1 Tax=Sphingomonas japonica TaxID=511662 RepID=A0ABX0TXE2_9SPHN|nr:aldo/keto reductase [Sphingomonas japonica]NIJ22979.1 diketogulonate reductase-like aldo/keto reductase [Sphingomonas japonica]
MPHETPRRAESGVPQRPFGPLQRNIGTIGQGTWYIEDGDPTAVIAALRRGIDLGMNHIDTAEMYGAGAAETLVGDAIAGRRDELFLVSKVLPQNASRRGTMIACERSLARLKTDRLDCYLLHWRGLYPLEETFAAFEALRDAGKILSYGVSNFDAPDLAEAWRIAGGSELVCNQVLYHLQERAVEHRVLPWCEQHGLAVTAYSPFGHGDFPGPATSGGRLLAEIAEAHDATARQIALAFLLSRPAVFAIPKASTIAHVEENAGAAAIALSPAEIDRIDAAFPRGPRPRSLPML